MTIPMPRSTAQALSCLTVLVAAGQAWAQTLPDAGQILQQQRQAPSGLPERLPAPQVTPARPELSPAASTRVRVRSVRFTGYAGLVSEADLQAQVADAIGKELDLAQLRQLAERVTQFLKSQGWLLARAYLPAQDVTEGALEIAILRGRIEGGSDGSGLTLDTKLSRLAPERVRRTVAEALFIDPTAEEPGLHARRLERALLLLNDLPGISARSTLEKGREADTTRLVVHAVEGPLLGGNLSIDNHGNRYTGSERLGGQLALNDPLGIGDQATVAVSSAARLNQASLGYSLPLGYQGWRLSFGHTTLRYRIGEELASSNSRGTAQTTQLGLVYPLIRSRDLNLRSQFAYEYKALYDEQLGVAQRDRRVDSLSAGLSGDRYDTWAGGGLLNFGAQLTQGHADLSRVSADVTADANPKAAGDFARFNASLARLQKLNAQWSLMGGLNGQWASKNLVSSEKFLLGGPSGVRAYPAGEAAGDEGLLGTLELRYDLPGRHAGGNVQLQGFIDAGRVRLNKNPWAGSAGNATGSNEYQLAGAGLGVSLSRVGAWNIRAVWATKLGSNPGRAQSTDLDADGRKDSNRFWLQAMAWL